MCVPEFTFQPPHPCIPLPSLSLSHTGWIILFTELYMSSPLSVPEHLGLQASVAMLALVSRKYLSEAYEALAEGVEVLPCWQPRSDTTYRHTGPLPPLWSILPGIPPYHLPGLGVGGRCSSLLFSRQTHVPSHGRSTPKLGHACWLILSLARYSVCLFSVSAQNHMQLCTRYPSTVLD